MNISTTYFKSLEENYKLTEEKCVQFESLIKSNNIDVLITALIEHKDDIINLINGGSELVDYILFPAIIEAHHEREVVESILELSKEHGMIECAIHSIYFLIENLKPNKNVISKVIPILITKTIQLIRKHNSDELKMFKSLTSI